MLPYNDEFMIFDERTNQYVLTEKALENAGIYIRARLSHSPVVNATNVINGLCRTATRHVYSFIHLHRSEDASEIDYYIANTHSLRDVMREALVEQFKFIYVVGDWTLSPDKDKRRDYLSAIVKDILLNAGLLFTGGY